MSTKTPSSSSASRSSASSLTRKAPSRTKATRIKTTKSDPDVTSDAPLDAEPAPKPRKTPVRRRASSAAAKAATAETVSDDSASVETKTPRKRSTAKTTAPATKKTTRTTRKKTVDADTAVEEAAPEAAPTATKKKATTTRRRTKKAIAQDEAALASAPEQDAAPSAALEEEKPAPKRRRVTRKKATPVVEESAETASDSAAVPTAEEQDAPAVKKPARRRAAKKTTAPKPEAKKEESVTQDEILPPQEETTKEAAPTFFSQLNLSAPILRAVEEMGYTQPTPIQEQAIPEILAGRDILGVAQTGTGKTASFTLPLLEKLSKSRARARMPRSLILEPTRELALQVAENFELYGKHMRLTHALLIGGGNMNEQRELLNRGVDVLIATPGRLLDLFGRGGLLLTKTDTLVIDEADRMLDMGFIPDIERIVSLLPRSRQTLFFSATMAPEIRRLTETFLSSPREITIARQSSVASTIVERLFLVEKSDKQQALLALLQEETVQNAIVFCNRKRDVDTLQRYLAGKGFAVGHLHGDLTQTLRFETLERFRSGELKVLVCSDIAARGIDIGGLSHVFNYDLPFNAEDYIHRIGRTGRAGKEGHAFTLVTPPNDQNLLEAIESLTKKKIEHGMIEGFPVLGWSQNMDAPAPSSSKASKPKAATSKKGTPKAPAPQQDAPEDAPEAPARKGRPARDNAQKESRKGKPRQDAERPSRRGPNTLPQKNGLLPPVQEQDGFQDGFGDYVPAFMTVSFRPPERHND